VLTLSLFQALMVTIRAVRAAISSVEKSAAIAS